MGVVNKQSLNATVDAIDEAFFFSRALSKADRVKAARWIAGRQGLPGSYHGMFALTKRDLERGFQAFTGDRMRTRASTSHVLSEEAARALILLDVDEAAVREALRRATENITPHLEPLDGPRAGFYCCGKCTVSYWRHLAVGVWITPSTVWPRASSTSRHAARTTAGGASTRSGTPCSR